jgi:hypothetical protein
MSFPAESIDSREHTPMAWRLWLGLVGAPVAWALHFMASYVLTEFGCASGWGGFAILGLSSIAVLQIALSLGALGVIGLAGLAAWLGLRMGDGQALVPGGSMGRAGAALAMLVGLVAAPCTLVALGLAGLAAWLGLRARRPSAAQPTGTARAMGRAGVALAILFGAAVALEAVPAVVLGGCG